MKITGLLQMIVITGILAILLLSGLAREAPVVMANEDQTSSKVSSLLYLHVQTKLHQFNIFGSGLETRSSKSLSNSCSEVVFLHFADEPGPEQLEELTALGITAYPDSWVPPAGIFKTGFILADMPVDKLVDLVGKDYVRYINTAEYLSFPQNDLARAAMNVGPVWSGGNTGAGVTVAVLDSGIDTSNADLPFLDSTNSCDYSAYPYSLDFDVINHVTGHGTHVAGSTLGRGVNSPGYKGIAPGADLVFLKIGGDVSSSATSAAIVGAILAALTVYHADIITMSYGGWSAHHDGTDEMCQAVDYAVSRGVTVFMSAGNNAFFGWHYSGMAQAGSTTDFIQVNVAGAGTDNTLLYFDLVWFDGIHTHNHLSLEYFDSSKNPLSHVLTGVQSESPRGTENVYSHYSDYLPSGDSTYYLKVTNTSPNQQFFHIYFPLFSRLVSFADPNPFYTLGSPAEADGAIAVGAYVTRTEWDDYQDQHRTQKYNPVLGDIATFSSRGPRVDDGAPGKPDLAAPGSSIISARDNDVYPWPVYNTHADVYPYNMYIIDDDGANPDGSGPANYFVMQGTSMAGITYDRLEKGGLQWPCPTPEHPGSPILHTLTFTRGKGHFMPLSYRPQAESPDREYPLALTTERSIFHYHTGTMTRRVAGLNLLRKEELVEINPQDAQKLGISDGDLVTVTSRRGAVTARAKVTDVSPAGLVSMTFHFGESPTNALTNDALDPLAGTPELKYCAMRVEKKRD